MSYESKTQYSEQFLLQDPEQGLGENSPKDNNLKSLNVKLFVETFVEVKYMLCPQVTTSSFSDKLKFYEFKRM